MAREPAMKITSVRGLGVSIILNISTMQDFNDAVRADYDTKNVYGRPDPIMSYNNTKRTIRMSWLAYTHRNPFLLRAIKSLQRLLYATYAKVGSNHILKDPPLFKVQFGTAEFGDDGQKATGFKEGYYMGVGKVYGVFDTFEVKIYDGKIYANEKEFIPDRVGIDATLTVLHHYNPGFEQKESITVGVEAVGERDVPTRAEIDAGQSFPNRSGDNPEAMSGGSQTPAGPEDLAEDTSVEGVLGVSQEKKALAMKGGIVLEADRAGARGRVDEPLTAGNIVQ